MDRYDNTIANKTTAMESYPDYMYVYDSLVVITCLVGLISDILIIINITKSERLRTSTNSVLVSWALSDGISLLCAPINYHLFQVHKIYIFNNQLAHCFLSDTEAIGRIIADMFLFALICNYIIQLECKYLTLVIINIFILGFAFWLSVATLCVFGHAFNYIIFIIIFLHVSIGVVVFYIRINSYIFGRENVSLNYRLNVVTIFISNWFVSLTFLFLSDVEVVWFFGFLDCICYLSALFILCYTIYTDGYFKISLLRVFRCKPNNPEESETVICFAKSCDELNIEVMQNEDE